MDFSQQRRVTVDGYHYSDIHVTIALVVLKTGGVGMVIDGLDPSLQNLVTVRQLMNGMVNEIDAKLPQLLQDNVKEMTNG